MAAKEKKCEHPPCSCKTTDGSKYCSVECEAMEKTPDLECLCPPQAARARSSRRGRLRAQLADVVGCSGFLIAGPQYTSRDRSSA
jgi:hypothetical protein